MKSTFEIKNISELKPLAKEMLSNDGPSIWAFYGEMGAGKTTLITEICQQLKVKEQVGSPTFNLINEYEAENDRMIYHFDFYRIDSIDEALEIGTSEYFDSEGLCLIEWPEKIDSLIPEQFRCINIVLEESGQRTIKINDYE